MDKMREAMESLEGLESCLDWAWQKDLLCIREALTPSPWIPCSERPPTEADGDFEHQVWVCNQIGAYRFDWAQIEVARREYGVTHWKPTGLVRPEPPEVEG